MSHDFKGYLNGFSSVLPAFIRRSSGLDKVSDRLTHLPGNCFWLSDGEGWVCSTWPVISILPLLYIDFIMVLISLMVIKERS